MLRDSSGFELRTRLTEAIYPGQVVFLGWTCEMIERVLAKTVWVVGSIALAGILIACLFYGDPIQAQAWALSLLALSLQTFFMFVIAPAFVPSDTHKRLAQLYLPISNKQISQTWFRRVRHGTAWQLAGIGFMATAGLCCQVSWTWTLMHVVWQMFVLRMVVRRAYAIVGSDCRYGAFGTTAWWVSYAVTGLGLMSLHVLQPGAPAFFAGPIWLVLKAPDWIVQFAGFNLTFALCLLAFAYAMMPRKLGHWSVSPSRHQIKMVCRFWRTLPDRDSPVLGNLNYPANAETTLREHAERPTLRPRSQLIREQVTCPHPLSLMPLSTCRKASVYAWLITLSILTLATVTDILKIKAGMSGQTILGLAVLTWHLPAIWGMVRLSSMADSGLVNAGNAYRLAVRGVWRDSLAVSLLCAPFIILVGYFTDDYRSSTVHVGICLLAGLVLRVLSGCLVWLPHKMLDVVLMGYALIGGFFFNGMIGLHGSSMAIITLGLPVAFGIYGWDRIAAQLHSPVNWICHASRSIFTK